MTIPSPSSSNATLSPGTSASPASDTSKPVRLPPIKTMFPEIFSPLDEERERSMPLSIPTGSSRGNKSSPNSLPVPEYVSSERFLHHRPTLNSCNSSSYSVETVSSRGDSYASSCSSPPVSSRLTACYNNIQPSRHSSSDDYRREQDLDGAKGLAKSMSHLKVSHAPPLPHSRSSPSKYAYANKAHAYESDYDDQEAQYASGGTAPSRPGRGRHASAGPGVVPGPYTKLKPSVPPLRTNLQPANWAT